MTEHDAGVWGAMIHSINIGGLVLAAAMTALCTPCHAQKSAPKLVNADADNAAGLALKVAPPGVIPLGSGLKFVVSTRKRGYLILMTVDPTGDVRQIFPAIPADGLPVGATDETNALKPGRPMIVPDAGNALGRFELVASMPGACAVIALLSPVPVQLVSLSEVSSASPYVRKVVDGVFEMVKSLRIAPRNERAALAAPKWSMLAEIYQVE